MKQIGLAIHGYISSHDVMPPVGSVDRNGNSLGGGLVPQTASIHLRLLNYLGQVPLYNAYNFMIPDFNANGAVAANTTVIATAVPGYLCPSDPNPGGGDAIDGGYNAPGGSVNYAANGGTNRQYNGGRVNGVAWWLGGNAAYGTVVTLAGITDGTSGTLAFGEWVKGNESQPANAQTSVQAIAQYANGGPTADQSTCLAASSAVFSEKGEYWTLQDTGRGGPFYVVMTPNQPACTVSTAFGNVDSFIGVGSLHPGGANVVFMDGSVRFLRDTVALQVWLGLGTRAGGEVLSSDAF